MKLSLKISVVVSACSLLPACATPEQRAAYERQQQYQAEQARIQAQQARQQYLSQLGSKCAQYGFKTGTDAYAQCVQNAEQQDEARNQSAY